MQSLALVVALALGQAAAEPPSIVNPEPSAFIPGLSAAADLPAADAPTTEGATTPQAEIDADGNLVIPGLGGMKFMRNGDIVDSNGKKIYDAATNTWTKDGLAAAGAAEEAKIELPQLRLDENFKSCVERFGEAEKWRDSYSFDVAPWTLSVTFHRDRAERILYMRTLGKRENFTSAKLYAKVSAPEPHFVAARELSAGQREWKEAGADARILGENVSTIIADYKPTADELADEKKLILPDVTWRTKGGQLCCSLEFDLLDGELREKLTIWTQAHQQRERARRVQVSEE